MDVTDLSSPAAEAIRLGLEPFERDWFMMIQLQHCEDGVAIVGRTDARPDGTVVPYTRGPDPALESPVLYSGADEMPSLSYFAGARNAELGPNSCFRKPPDPAAAVHHDAEFRHERA